MTIPSSPAELRHPDSERLALHAAGQLRPVERAIVEAHLAFCSACTGRLRELLEPGGRWLSEVAGAEVTAAAWERLERRLDDASPAIATIEFPEARMAGASLPAAAWEELGIERGAVRWRGVPGTRARIGVLSTDQEADIDLVMVGLAGGQRFPRHLHLGNEEVMMLAGGYTDEFTHLDAGDYFHYAPGTEHGALTDRGEICWTLGLLEHGVRFRGVLGLLQWLFDPASRARFRRYRQLAALP
jgi:putative transcriptional regulator